MKASVEAIEFDTLAGLRNNVGKYVAIGNTQASRKLLSTLTLEGKPITVTQDCNLVGIIITTKRAPRRQQQNARVLHATKLAIKTAKSWVSNDIKAHAAMMAVIPKMVYGALWTFPTSACTGKLRSATIGAVWGMRQAMRCPEVVVGLLYNPVRVDPTSAMVYRGLCDLRRLFGKSQEAYDQFKDCLQLIDAYASGTPRPTSAIQSVAFSMGIDTDLGDDDCDSQDIQGPAHGFISLLQQCGARHVIQDDGDVHIFHDGTNSSISFSRGSEERFRRLVQSWCRWRVFQALSERVNKVDSDGIPCGDRKDMRGMTANIDLHATLSCHGPKPHKVLRSQHPDANDHH